MFFIKIPDPPEDGDTNGFHVHGDTNDFSGRTFIGDTFAPAHLPEAHLGGHRSRRCQGQNGLRTWRWWWSCPGGFPCLPASPHGAQVTRSKKLLGTKGITISLEAITTSIKKLQVFFLVASCY